MKIIHINAVYGIMSTGGNTEDLVRFAISQGHESLAIYGQMKNCRPNSVYWGNIIDHKIHALISRISGGYAHGSIISTKRLVGFLRKEKPDIVHIQDVHANYVNLEILVSYLAQNDIPTVITLHDCFYFTGGCMHYTANQCYKWKTDCEECQYVRRNIVASHLNSSSKELQRRIKLFNSIPRLGVIGVSDWITNEAKQSPVFQKAKIIQRIYNWVDMRVFKPQGKEVNSRTRELLNLNGKYMLIAVSSNWIPAKGLNDFVQLANALGSDYDIVLVGKRPESITLPPNVHAIGSVYDKHKLACLYSAANAFVHLSWEETFGKVAAEAMACGTPIVVYNSTALPEIVTAKTGCIIEKRGDIELISAAVKHIVQIDKDAYSKSCVERVNQLFEIDRNCQQHIELYKSLKETLL